MENVRTTALIAFSLLVALALLPANAAAQQKSLKEQLVGSWALVSTSRQTEPSDRSSVPAQKASSSWTHPDTVRK